MSGNHALSPREAAFIATNAYFTLSGWEENYKFKKKHGPDAKGAPKPTAGMASKAVINRQVVGSGDTSVAKAGISGGKISKSFEGTAGSNLGRVKSGFGYILQFERSGKSHLVFAIRGTRPEYGLADIITDANFSANRLMPQVGPVHSGFYDVYSSLKPTLANARDEIQAADYVHVVGHSLGGAIANLVAIHIARSAGKKVRLYTFGAPRVGLGLMEYDNIVKKIIGEENIFRVSHNFDPVPMVPVAPFCHVLPSLDDKNNFFIGSTVNRISGKNHDMTNYIASMGNKKWRDLDVDKRTDGFLNQQYFTSWRNSDSWLKRYIGHKLNAKLASLQRVLLGMVNTLGVKLMKIATVLDLLALAIKHGVKFYDTAKGYVARFIQDCARMFNAAVGLTASILRKLLIKMANETARVVKEGLDRAGKVIRSREFRAVLAAGVPAASIGVLLL